VNAAAPASGERFSFVQRVRFADLDALGHVNNVEFLRFVETARIAYVRSLMPDYTPLLDQGFSFILAESQISYRSPAFLDEDLRTTIHAAQVRRSSVLVAFEMRVEGDGRLVAEGHNVVVGYDFSEARPRPLPDDLRARLTAQDVG